MGVPGHRRSFVGRRGVGTLLAAAVLAGSLALAPVGSAEPVAPAQILGPGGVQAGLRAWFDASDLDADGNAANNPAEGSPVSSWVSRSQGGLRAEQVSGKNPATFVTADGINGQPTLRFNRVNDSQGSVLRVTGLDLRASVTEDTTVFTVYRPRSRSANNGVWGVDNGNWDRFFLSFHPAFGNRVDDGLVSLGPAQAGAVVGGAGQIGVVRLLTIVYDGNVSGTVNSGPTNGSAAYFNGELVRRFTDSTHPTDAQRSLAIGWDGDNSVFDGDIAELIVYDRVLTGEELRDVNFYLSQKYDFDVVGPGTVPGPPTNLVATPSGTNASIAFIPGPDGGSPITGYDYSLDGGRTWTTPNPAVTGSPLVLSGLVVGQDYSVILRAVNALGAGSASEEVNFTLATVPEAPINLVATPGEGVAKIAFTETDDGGSPITNYEYRVDGGSWVAFDPAKVSSPVVVPGLVNDVAVSIELRAVNAIGASPASLPVTVTPTIPVLRPPSAPLNLVAVPQDGQATVSFTEPLDPGDRPISGYEYSVDGGRTYTPIASPPPPGTSVTITGLANGVINEIVLRAVSAAGAGAPSRPVESLYAVVPDAPFDLLAVAEPEGVTIIFTDGDDGGSAITDHEYSINGGEWLSFTTPQNSSPVSIDGLDPGVPLSIRLRAVNDVGPGAASLPIEFTPLGPPSPPRDVDARRSGSTVTLTWTPPLNDGGRPVTGYVVEMAPTRSGPWQVATDACSPAVAGVSSSTSCSFAQPDLTIAVFRVKAINAVGTSEPSGTSRDDCPVEVNPFGDVLDGVWYTLPVACIAERGITTGWGGNAGAPSERYRPGGSVTRAQAVAALWRKVARPEPPLECGFTDVLSDRYWSTAACWALAQGVTTGVNVDGTLFAPDGLVTRAQMAAFLWRFAGEPSGAPQSPFTDVPTDAYFAEAVDWLFATGISVGVGGNPTTFAPNEVLTRAQMAAMIFRLGAQQGDWSTAT
jgi:hypothetical protein